jgi:hypothetical protein
MSEQIPTNRPAIDSSVYDFAPGATADDVQELIEKKLERLDAMLLMTWGVGGETFGRVLDASARDSNKKPDLVSRQRCAVLRRQRGHYDRMLEGASMFLSSAASLGSNSDALG